MRKVNERGFTLLELCVVTGFLLVAFAAASIFLLSPKDVSAKQLAAQRRLDLASMAQAINQYASDNGNYPADIPKDLTAIGSPDDHYDLCAYVVPKYLKDIPLDPGAGAKTRDDFNIKDTTCDTKGINYGSAYAIMQDRQGRVTLSAPISEEEPIQIVLPTYKRP